MSAPVPSTTVSTRASKRPRRPHPRLDSYKRTWYFLRRNTLALFGLGVLLFFVFVAIYATTQPLQYYGMDPYCATEQSYPTLLGTQTAINAVPSGLPNGVYSWQVVPINGWSESPSSGSLQVNGHPVTVFITFTRHIGSIAPPPPSGLHMDSTPTYAVSFVASGFVAQTTWEVQMNYTSPSLCLSTGQTVCTYPAGSSPPAAGCYQTPTNNPSEVAPTINLARFSAGPLPLGSLTIAPSISTGFFNVYAGLLRGSDWSLLIATSIVGGGAVVGLIVGAISGFYGGVVDEALMRLVDIFLSIPQILFVIVVIAVITTTTQSFVGLGPQNTRIFLLIIGFLVTWWPFYARVVRGQVLVVREQKYVEAARAAGASRGRIIRRHIIPNSVYPVFIQMSLDVGTIPLLIGALVFLGFSLFTTPYFPEWGAISANSVRNLEAILLTCIQPTGCVIPWWQLLFPGLVLFMFAISVNFLSDGLRDALDPRLRR
jgi:peptide/nickel transport system permease protein